MQVTDSGLTAQRKDVPGPAEVRLPGLTVTGLVEFQQRGTVQNRVAMCSDPVARRRIQSEQIFADITLEDHRARQGALLQVVPSLHEGLDALLSSRLFRWTHDDSNSSATEKQVTKQITP